MSNASAEPIITVEQLDKRVATYEGHLDILSSIELTINRSDTVAIVGASGSGKSTLLSMMAGLDLPSAGRVTVAGQRLTELDEDGRAAVRRRYVGFVFQSFQLLPGLTALENVMLPLELAAIKKPRQAATQQLHRVGLSERLTHYPNQLSGGEQQRVALARAFVTTPKILFADEPTGNLDSVTGKQIIELLFEMNHERQTTLILVTHDNALAARCHRTVELAEGRIIRQQETVE